MLIEANFYALYNWVKREYFADERVVCGRVVLHALCEYIKSALQDLHKHNSLIIQHAGRERIEVNDILLALNLGTCQKYHIVQQVKRGELWKYLDHSIYLLSEPQTIKVINVSHMYIANSCRKLLANLVTTMLYVILHKCFYMARRLHINRMDLEVVQMMMSRIHQFKERHEPAVQTPSR